MDRNGFSFSTQGDVLLHSPHSSHSQEAIARIRDLLEQDDQDASLSSFGDLIALRTKASEFAAILKEDSPALNLNSSPSDDSVQQTSHVGTQQHVNVLASLTKCSAEFPGNRVVLWNSLTNCQSLNCMPSRVLDVGLLRRMRSHPSTLHEREKDEVSDAEKDVNDRLNHAEAQRAARVLKPRTDLSISKPRFHKHTDLSINKRRYCDEYIGVKIGKAGLPMYIELHDMLLHCAYAIGLNDTNSAEAVACKVKQQVSSHGSAAERLAHYFVKALYARFAGTGWSLYTGGHLSQPRPSATQILEASMKYISSCPFTKASHLFANESVLRVAKGASTLHIIEHQMSGLQYPSLFKELAALPGGPPKVFLVGLVVPHYSMLPAQAEVIFTALVETGRRLAKCAALCKVPFHFTPWVGTREKMRLQDFVSSNRPPEEVFVFISTCFLRFVMDDILDPRPIRLRSFKMLCDVRPDVFIQGVVSGAYSSPFYSTRFKEALFHFACIFDVLDTFIERNNQDRLVFESEILGKAILNVVACEGSLVSGRVEKYKQWQAALEEAGMQQLSLKSNTIHQVEGLLKSWHKDYMITEDRNYLLLGWKGRILYALSTWKSAASS